MSKREESWLYFKGFISVPERHLRYFFNKL